jgi:hypothetical protein
MQKVWISFVAFLCLIPASTAQSQKVGMEANFRYSEQESNGPTGTCGCFGMFGAAGDFYFNLKHYTEGKPTAVGLVTDIGYQHTGNVNGAGYGLTLTTVAWGPRIILAPVGRAHPFAQVLLGFAHGSGSEFPVNNTLVTSANSLAFDVGAGADYSVSKRLSMRFLQVDYMRTGLPNNVNNWQNNLRIGAGVTLHF